MPQFKTKKPITLKDLMLHQSGLYKYKGSKNRLNLDEAVAAIQKKGINRKYYHKHFYNDANYLVLAKVIEKVTHQSYTENYYKHFGSPLNLKHSAFFNDVRYQEDMAKGYKRNKNVPVFTPTLFLDQYYGAGNLYMSTHDMGLVVRNLQMNRMFPENVTQPYIHEINTARYP
ncbi:serine hydrolase domain-containing protein, partial [Staphylococcus aureus]